jgi:hypothetical protein
MNDIINNLLIKILCEKKIKDAYKLHWFDI